MPRLEGSGAFFIFGQSACDTKREAANPRGDRWPRRALIRENADSFRKTIPVASLLSLPAGDMRSFVYQFTVSEDIANQFIRLSGLL